MEPSKSSVPSDCIQGSSYRGYALQKHLDASSPRTIFISGTWRVGVVEVAGNRQVGV